MLLILLLLLRVCVFVELAPNVPYKRVALASAIVPFGSLVMMPRPTSASPKSASLGYCTRALEHPVFDCLGIFFANRAYRIVRWTHEVSVRRHQIAMA